MSTRTVTVEAPQFVSATFHISHLHSLSLLHLSSSISSTVNIPKRSVRTPHRNAGLIHQLCRKDFAIVSLWLYFISAFFTPLFFSSLPLSHFLIVTDGRKSLLSQMKARNCVLDHPVGGCGCKSRSTDDCGKTWESISSLYS